MLNLELHYNQKKKSNELFKNPVVRIQLPEKIENIKVNSISLIYEDELKIKSSKLNGKTIEVTLMENKQNIKMKQ